MAERRLSQSTIEELGVVELVDDLLADKAYTYERIAEVVFTTTGKRIGLSQISRHYQKRFLKSFEKVREVEKLVDQLMEKESEIGQVDAAAALRRMILTNAVEAVSEMKTEDITNMSPDKLALMITRLERTALTGKKLRAQYDRGISAAKEAILAELERELGGDAELMARIREKAEAATAKAEKEAAA